MQRVSLNGAWTVTQVGTQETIPAQVPGTIHLDLLRAGRIADPYYRDNEDRLQWIGEASWRYHRQFTVTEELLSHDHVILRCAGLDTLATIYINAVQIACTDNMFRTWEFDIKEKLIVGENTIEVQFASAPDYINACQLTRELPSWAGKREMQGRCWIRKEPCNFGWDWGPVLITCGIWRPIELVAFSTARITGVHIQQDHLLSGQVVLRMSATVDAIESPQLSATFTITHQQAVALTVTGTVVGNRAAAEVTIAEPQLWWPNGMGKQPLYTVACQLQDAQGRMLDETSRRIGLRTLRLERLQDTWGESFQFAVNGIPFFAKGTNWIPADTFAPRVTREQYADLLRSAVDANMNMVRAWGGGIYEEDIFYDLCDELGLCVWQDFLFACSTYPTFDETFTQNVLAEVVDNVSRLRHHPCIALWCGNNELEMGLVGQEWAVSQMSWEDYTRLFDNMLPEVVTLLDPERDYWPGSPHSPYGDREDVSNPRWGDAHLWDVWHKKEPFEWYRTCEHRFISEFGFQSFPEPQAVDTFTEPEDRNVTSYIMEHHQRSIIGNSTILTYMLEWFQLPVSFDMTLWLSQILQGLGMQYGVEHWRRNMPRTMGTLYWQLDDCWPVASWSSIDYYGNWKALHYLAKRFYAPLLISGVENQSQKTVDIHVTSDLLQACTGEVTWSITDTVGHPLASNTFALDIPAQQDSLVTTVAVQPFIGKNGVRDLLVWFEAWKDGACASRNLASFARPKHLKLLDPQLSRTIQVEDPQQYLVTITAHAPALWVWATVHGRQAHYSENFIHLQGGESIQMRIVTAEPIGPEEFERALQLYSLYDTYHLA